MPVPKTIIHLRNINDDIKHAIFSSTQLLRYCVFVWQKKTSKMMFGNYPCTGNIIENNTVELINLFVEPRKSPHSPTTQKVRGPRWAFFDLHSPG
jgi:modification methylase